MNTKKLMQKIMLILLMTLFAYPCFAAIDADTVWEFRATATANMVNGGGYNSTNASPGTDYSQQNTAQINNTDLAIDGVDNTKITSAGSPFTSVYNGNIIHITAGTGFTAGWYEIVSVDGSNIATLDRACGTAGSTGGTFYVGGSMNVGGSLEKDFFNMTVAGNMVWIKNGTYSISEAMSLVGGGSATAPIIIKGYNLTRGDNPTGANRPTWAMGSSACTWYGATQIYNIIFTTTNASGIQIGAQNTPGGLLYNCKSTNSSGSAGAIAFSAGSGNVCSFNNILFCEAISTNGIGISESNSGTGAGSIIAYNYVHDSVTGIKITGESIVIVNNIIDNCSTVGINVTTSLHFIGHNTIYGAETPTGTGINVNSIGSIGIVSNIIYGWTTGILRDSAGGNIYVDFNDYYNNTTNLSNVTSGDNDILTDPLFTNAASGDFTLQSSSPAIGTGASVGVNQGATGDYQWNIGVDQDDNTSGGGSFAFFHND